MKKSLTIVLLIILSFPLFSQQVADTSYKPTIAHPAYEAGKGSVVFIDEGHFNFHTKDGRYTAFARLLERDGYVVEGYEGIFNKKQLSQGKILVISNALNELNVQNWYLPNPSAFTKKEIKTVKKWVANGGSLFLIADHMPMAGAAEDLAAAFGFTFTNGFVLDTVDQGPGFFKKSDGTLVESIITEGRNKSEQISQAVSFTGQAFKIPAQAEPVLLLNDNFVNLLPDTAWVFNESTQRIPAKGWCQGAYMKYGKGRIAIFGEAAMFTAQLAGPEKRKAGMNHPIAAENYQLLLNIVHWLDGKLE